jgi:hypothetical protein
VRASGFSAQRLAQLAEQFARLERRADADGIGQRDFLGVLDGEFLGDGEHG